MMLIDIGFKPLAGKEEEVANLECLLIVGSDRSVHNELKGMNTLMKRKLDIHVMSQLSTQFFQIYVISLTTLMKGSSMRRFVAIRRRLTYSEECHMMVQISGLIVIVGM